MQFIRLSNNKKYLFLLIFFLPVIYGRARKEGKPLPASASTQVILTSGYVFKHDDYDFKKLYDNGIPNILTLDACHYFLESWGIGAKVSYWRTKGKPIFFQNPSYLQEVPLTAYLRTLWRWSGGLKPYISLGGGAIFVVEKSYEESVKTSKGIGEVELGLNWFISNKVSFSAAFRYLFPREAFDTKKIDIGGIDVRAGIGFSY